MANEDRNDSQSERPTNICKYEAKVTEYKLSRYSGHSLTVTRLKMIAILCNRTFKNEVTGRTNHPPNCWPPANGLIKIVTP